MMSTESNLEQIRLNQERGAVEESVVRAVLSRVPPSWSLVVKSEDGGMFVRGGIQVILSVAREDDGNIWVHVSACGRRGEREFYLPSWEQFQRVKSDFLGSDRWAYQGFPDEKHYLNQNPYLLQLFMLL